MAKIFRVICVFRGQNCFVTGRNPIFKKATFRKGAGLQKIRINTRVRVPCAIGIISASGTIVFALVFIVAIR